MALQDRQTSREAAQRHHGANNLLNTQELEAAQVYVRTENRGFSSQLTALETIQNRHTGITSPSPSPPLPCAFSLDCIK